MAKTIMIQGTASNAGKSLITAGLCRIFMQDGYKVAPFKSQNMALNSFITKDGFEMGRAQAMQAEACQVAADVRMNPILLKPTSERTSQVIVNGEVRGTMNAKDYFAEKPNLVPEVMEAFNSLAAENDIIVIEGAGSPAEINLRKDDIANMGMAKLAKAPVIIVGDIDRGGVFAALAGTMLLLEDDEKKIVKGTVINKFRGDGAILAPGLRQLEDVIHVPVLGVVPYVDVKIDDEDSVTDRFTHMPEVALIDIAVMRLPHISNFTDFNPLEYVEGVSLRYVTSMQDFGKPDLVILPGTKSTMADLAWLRQSGLEALVLKHAHKNKPIIGICGGYQMLGGSLSDPCGVEQGGELKGLGLLPQNTVFEQQKTRLQSVGTLNEVTGMFSQLSGEAYTGYEIHMGQSDTLNNMVNNDNVYGTYIHGLFDTQNVVKTVVSALLKEKGLDFSDIKTFDLEAFKQTQYDLLADTLRKALDMNAIYKILEEGI